MSVPDLEDRIREAAASPRGTVDVESLWTDGVRARRRRRAGVAGVSLAVVAAGLIVVPDLVNGWTPQISGPMDAVDGGRAGDQEIGEETPSASCDETAGPPSVTCPNWDRAASGVVVAPVAEGGQVFVGTANRLVAVDVATGGTVWTSEFDGPVNVEPAIDEELVLVSHAPQQLSALDRETGQQRWTVPIGVARAPVVAGESVAVPTDDQLVGLSMLDGSQRWAVPMKGELTRPVVEEGTLFVGDGKGIVKAVDASTGQVTWEAETGNGTHLSLDADGEVVVASGFDRPVVGFDRRSGERLWTSDANAASPAPVLLDGGHVVQAMEDGRLVIFDTVTGTTREIARVWGASQVTVGPDGLLYVLEADGDATALTPDGRQVWAADTRVDSLTITGTPTDSWMVAVDQVDKRLLGIPAPTPGSQ